MANTKQQQAHALLMDEMVGVANVMADWQQMLVKIGIGYVYAALAFVAGDHLIAMCITAAMPLWMNYIIAFAGLCALIALIVYTMPAVANGVFDGSVFVGRKIAAGYKWVAKKVPSQSAARQRVSDLGKWINAKRNKEAAVH